jgi:hypothetical protein
LPGSRPYAPKMELAGGRRSETWTVVARHAWTLAPRPEPGIRMP